MTEVAYALHDDAKYLVASEGFIRTHETNNGLYLNWHVDEIYGALVQNSWMSPADVCVASVTSFQTDTMYVLPPSIVKPQSVDTISALDLSSVDTLVTALDEFAQRLMKQSLFFRMRMPLVFLATQSFSGGYDFFGATYYPTYVDVYDFARAIRRHSPNVWVRQAALQVMNAVEKTVLLNRHGSHVLRGEHPDAYGVSVYLPYRKWVYDKQYETLAFAQDTQWDEFIASLWL